MTRWWHATKPATNQHKQHVHTTPAVIVRACKAPYPLYKDKNRQLVVTCVDRV